MKANEELIEVRGLSEKIIQSDIGDISIKIFSKSVNLEELYKKRISDKNKIMKFLKDQGVTYDEIINSSTDTNELEEEVKTVESGITLVNKKKYFKAEDILNIRTKNIEKIGKIKSEIIKLSSEGILLTCEYGYKLTNFADIKMKMMEEASLTARKNAEAFVKPQGCKINEVIYLRQGEISIRGEDESENIESWNSKENISINKKLRLVVRGGFSKK